MRPPVSRAPLQELLWFVAGATDSTLLSSKDIHIWDGNGSRAFLDSRGLSHRAEGDLGPVYGFQWRHFGAEYVDCKTDYKGKGVDQLADCIWKIRNNPTDRRIVLSAWNPAGQPRPLVPFSSVRSLTALSAQTSALWPFRPATCSASSTSPSPTLRLPRPSPSSPA